ncbi:MAG: hypothetical protein QXI42_10010 [Thermoproteota archaeon]
MEEELSFMPEVGDKVIIKQSDKCMWYEGKEGVITEKITVEGEEKYVVEVSKNFRVALTPDRFILLSKSESINEGVKGVKNSKLPKANNLAKIIPHEGYNKLRKTVKQYTQTLLRRLNDAEDRVNEMIELAKKTELLSLRDNLDPGTKDCMKAGGDSFIIYIKPGGHYLAGIALNCKGKKVWLKFDGHIKDLLSNI